MNTTSIQMAIADVGELAERKLKTIDLPGKALPRWVWRVVQFLHLKKINASVAVLVRLCELFKLEAVSVASLDNEKPIDDDFQLRAHLDDAKKHLTTFKKENETMCQVMRESHATELVLFQQMKKMDMLAQELYAQINRLEWAVAEHDANFHQHPGQIQATDSAQLNAALDKILAA